MSKQKKRRKGHKRRPDKVEILKLLLLRYLEMVVT